MMDSAAVSRDAREVEQIRVELLQRIAGLRAVMVQRRGRVEGVIAAASQPDAERYADRFAAAVDTLDEWDRLDREGIAAWEERADWLATLSAELRGKARSLRADE
jgi:hypothetical protein